MITARAFDRIVASMRVPVVRPEHVVFHGDPFYHGDYSTWNDGIRTMFLLHDAPPRDVRHELGHCFDAHCLRDAHRELLLKWWGLPGHFWWWDAEHDPFERREGPDAGCEIFADRYAAAAASRSVRFYRFKKLIRTAYKEAGYVD